MKKVTKSNNMHKLPPKYFRWELGPIIATTRNSVIRTGNIYRNGIPTPVAIKSSPSSRSLSLQKEKGILHALHKYPEIIRCHGAELSSFVHPAFDNNDDNETYHLFLELAPHGSLSALIASEGPLLESQTQSYTQCILLGLCCIHSKGYVHCDINPKNILVWSSEDVKIADFGSAKRAGEMVKGLRGTLQYIAPESFTREEYEKEVDVWALGCVVIEMASGMPAWKFPEGKEGVRKAMRVVGRSEELPEMPEGLSGLGRDFVSKCLVKDPDERWTVEMLLGHPFVSDGDDGSDDDEEEELVLKLRVKPLGLRMGAEI